jgi:hypothetical protein
MLASKCWNERIVKWGAVRSRTESDGARHFGSDSRGTYGRFKLNLRTREIESTDYAASANPPVLHRKETFLLPEDPRWAKFDRLTRQEERAGLLDEPATIGTRTGWAERLRERGYALRGHRLVRSRTGDRPSGDDAG